MIKEACVDTLEQALSAARNGADQIELCANLEADGLTPDDELIRQVADQIDIPIKVMIRSRIGDFFYTEEELDDMVADVLRIKQNPISGFVFGALILTEEQSIRLDMHALRRISEAAAPLPITVHKAIDLCTDILSEIPQLKDISNIRYLLTSGGQATAQEGLAMLKAMHTVASPEIAIIGAGKITFQNLSDLDNSLKLTHYHGKKIIQTLD